MDTITGENLIWFIVGVVTGIITTILAITIFKKKEIDTVHLLNVIMFFVWVLLHIYGFINGISVPVTFDLIAGASVGHLLGLDVVSLLDKVKRK